MRPARGYVQVKIADLTAPFLFLQPRTASRTTNRFTTATTNTSTTTMKIATALFCLGALLFCAAAADAYGSASITCSGVPFTLKWDTAGATNNIQVISLTATVPSYVSGPIQCDLSALPAAFQSNLGTRTYGYGTSVNTYGTVASAFFAKPAGGNYAVSLYPDVTIGQGSAFQPGTKINDSFTWISA